MSDSVGVPRRPPLAVGVIVVAFALLLSVWAVVLVSGQRQATVGAPIAVLAMIVPIVFARRAPLAAAATLVVAAGFNELAFGHLIRCGPALPAAFFVAYVLGNRTDGWTRLAGLGCVLAGVLVQCAFDPRLHLSAFVLIGPASLLFFGAGVAVRSRTAMLVRLRDRNAQLRTQREQTARLAVEADRARIRVDLDENLRTRIRNIGRAAEKARTGTEADVEASFAEIEMAGRDTLDLMRDAVRTMQSGPLEPEPGLDDLANLLRRATTTDVGLTVTGDVRALPPSIELSGYRIVEHLLSVLQDDPGARAHVRVRFEADRLELTILGPPAADFDVASVLAIARDRAALHGGTVEIAQPSQASQQWEARVRLPLVSGYA